jgi:hypothetical protein
MRVETHVHLHVDCPLLSDFNRQFNLSVYVSKTPKYNVLFSGPVVVTWGRRTRRET